MSASIIRELWERVQARDWARVAELLHPDVVVDWPHSYERIRGRDNYVAIQREYPGTWTCRVLSVSAGPERVACEVRVDHDIEVCFGSGFYEVREGLVMRGTEYWTTAGSQEPVLERAHLTEPMDR